MKKALLAMALVIWCLAVALAMTACGGGASETPAVAAKTTPVHVTILGDSTAAQFQVLQNVLPVGSTVDNGGYNGLCIGWDYDWLVWRMAQAGADDTIVLFIGINDARKCHTDVAEFLYRVQALRSAAGNRRFIVMTPNPTIGWGNEDDILEMYATAERHSGLELFDLRSKLQGAGLPFDYANELINGQYKDGTHMTAPIYAWLASELARVL
jgi:lysophospholipase L1-like esterase